MSSTIDSILLTLRTGPMSASELAQRLRVDQATVSRQLNRLGDQVIRAGAGRSTLWYLPRPLDGSNAGQGLPVYRVDETGATQKIANLYPVYPVENYLVQYFRTPAGAKNNAGAVEWTHYESLPWWLTDMRPQGFLGRSFANKLRAAGEGVDADPRMWSEDNVLSVLARFPQDNIGNLLIGEEAYEEWLRLESSLSITQDQAGDIADAIARGEHFDSSAQGEQPKFTARMGGIECIVKFTGQVHQLAVDTVANRWADLLRVEALVSQVLNDTLPGLAAVNSSFSAHGRTFMVSQRFDRTAEWGRIGVISLGSLDADFVGQANEDWPVIMEVLERGKVVTEQALVYSKLLWAFGQLIANSDMHLGNLSVLNTSGRPYSLAPVYDMLPMHFAPTAGGDLPAQTRDIRLCHNIERVHWETAYSLALTLWGRVLDDPAISDHFKAAARSQREVVQAFENVIGRMA
ncbi:type II toxin-antitoxin system HipA family toxin YjjJ [Aliidiomarina sp. Khilg15.8]